MISNTVIRSGFSRVSLSGKYFNLVSAGGIIEVELLKGGKQVFKSRMWVGMNIGHPIDFDEIVLRGDDSIVEFWAGNVSMSQNRGIMIGASAIRASTKYVNGETLLAGSDLTRTAVRIRSDKEIFVGGSGFGASGWRVLANQVEEIPLAGMVSAYKPQAFLDFSKTIEHGELQDYWVPSGQGYCWTSDDGVTRLATEGTSGDTLHLSINSGVDWVQTHSNVIAYLVDPNTGIHYLLRVFSTEVRFFSSVDGISWDTLTATTHAAALGVTLAGRASIIGKLFQQPYQGGSLIINMETGELTTKLISPLGGTSAAGFWLDDELTVGVFHVYGPNGVYRTIDGGDSWELVLDMGISYMKAAPDGINLCITVAASVYLSEDGGKTWFLAGGVSVSSGSTPTHLANCTFVFYRSGRLIYATLNAGNPVIDYLTAQGLNSHCKFVGFNPSSGLVYTDRNAGSRSHQATISIAGDLSPARVEVMELLS